MYDIQLPKQEIISKREKEVLCLISHGNTNKQIAAKLCLSIHTVNTHKRHLLEKLNASNSALLIRKAFELGMLRIHSHFEQQFVLH